MLVSQTWDTLILNFARPYSYMQWVYNGLDHFSKEIH